MNEADPLAPWRNNPFFMLELSTKASRAEVERAGQRLLGLLAIGSAGAGHYHTPLGAATRDADGVRQALAALRDPNERVLHELWASVAQGAREGRGENPASAWKAAEQALGWAGSRAGKCPA
jgi:hypothetical protein